MSFAEQVAVAAHIAQVLGAVGTVGGILYVAAQLRDNASASRATFLLELENMSHDYDAVHEKLRPQGAWAEKKAGPATPKEWMQAEDYLRFFVYCEVLIRQGSLDPNTFWSLFGYRLERILANEVIVKEKLIAEREDWRLLWVLLRRFRLAHRIPRTASEVVNDAAHAHQ